ncbi:uncharacterized protein LOC131158631 [Malania oleifera]|uniref:uncharacterized protein LOC131158631 n=1 Tax=Malania oleifera TaxID=397392 RepID=UPI0025AE315B|nr:uncharacterized protein LOC131158631 [Malania oleifera]
MAPASLATPTTTTATSNSGSNQQFRQPSPPSATPTATLGHLQVLQQLATSPSTPLQQPGATTAAQPRRVPSSPCTRNPINLCNSRPPPATHSLCKSPSSPLDMALGGRHGRLPSRLSTTSLHEDDPTSSRPTEHVGPDATPSLSKPLGPWPDMDTTVRDDTQDYGVVKNTKLKKHLERMGQRIWIDIPLGFTAPHDDWCPAWTWELGIIYRQYALVTTFSLLMETKDNNLDSNSKETTSNESPSVP